MDPLAIEAFFDLRSLFGIACQGVFAKSENASQDLANRVWVSDGKKLRRINSSACSILTRPALARNVREVDHGQEVLLIAGYSGPRSSSLDFQCISDTPPGDRRLWAVRPVRPQSRPA
jgi:hypothetical protein